MRWCLNQSAYSHTESKLMLTLFSSSASPMDISNKVSPLVLRYNIHSSKASTAASKGVCGDARKGTKWDGIEAERDMMCEVG
jgi:hypothetical protein